MPVSQAGTSNGCADPIMTGFGGRSFNFIGEPDKIYNLISSKNHQMSAKLQFAQMWDHNGTTMSVRTQSCNPRADYLLVICCWTSLLGAA